MTVTTTTFENAIPETYTETVPAPTVTPPPPTDHAPVIHLVAVSNTIGSTTYQVSVVATDPDNDPLTYSSDAATLTANPDGSYTLTRVNGHGLDITVDDGQGQSATAELVLLSSAQVADNHETLTFTDTPFINGSSKVTVTLPDADGIRTADEALPPGDETGDTMTVTTTTFENAIPETYTETVPAAVTPNASV
jgi:Big-like domain-containing protein